MRLASDKHTVHLELVAVRRSHPDRRALSSRSSRNTAGTGTQRWKANWQNTVDFGKSSLTATAYYTSGYNYSAEDQGNVAGDCGLVPTNQDGDAYQPCNVKSFVQVDLHGAVSVTPQLAFYVDVLNVADRKPPIDGTTYGAYLYNPVVGEGGIVGRAFRVGAKVDF